MSNKVFPIIYFNLGGEMFYVIRQRLIDQNIEKDKAERVLLDILNAMFKDVLVEEIFKTENIYTKEATQTFFEKLVHSSIMRLNRDSMNKLFDLMFMVFKYQMTNCIYPEDILSITLNHLDGIKQFSAITPDLKRKVETVLVKILNESRVLMHLEFERIHEVIMRFLEDCNAKVSVLIKNGLQHTNGELIGPDPEKKRKANELHLKKNKAIQILGENVKDKWFASLPEDYCELDGNRGLELGKDIYSMSKLALQSKENVSDSNKKTKDGEDNEKPLIQEEITLLGRLIGNCSLSDFTPDIILLSPEEDLEECSKETFEKNDCCVLSIDASQPQNEPLVNISTDFDIKENHGVSCLLELLDCAGNEV